MVYFGKQKELYKQVLIRRLIMNSSVVAVVEDLSEPEVINNADSAATSN